MMYGGVDVFGIIAGAANIRRGDNPPYTKDDFLAMYPQFAIVQSVVLDAYVQLAHASISKARYHDAWEMCMGFFIAHWLTLYLQTLASPEDPIGKIMNAGLAKGVQSSKSADDLSVSYDFSLVSGDMEGWGTYKMTAFGQQLVTFAKMFSMGGMVVW